MVDGTWLWYEWTALFVLLTALSFSAVGTWYVLHQKGHQVFGALGLVAWVYAGSFAMMVFIQ